MKKIPIVSAILGVAMCWHVEVSAQGFLKKLKDKASEVGNKVVDQKIDQAVGVDSSPAPTNSNSGGSDNTSATSSNGSSSSSRSGRPSNKVGEGLKNTTPPDVN